MENKKEIIYDIKDKKGLSLIFIPKISRYANLYFFIQNLSEWHISTRKKHNEVWRAELSFSPETDLCIQEFKKIHKKYPFGDNYLGRPFFLYNDPWTQVEILVGKKTTSNIQNIFATLEPYFDIIYTKDKPKLQEWAKIIENLEFVNKASNLNKLLSKFYGSQLYDEPCTIFLLLSTEGKNGGTAGTIDNNTITLEVSRTSTKLEKLEINILWHELIHLYFRNFVFLPLLKKYSNDDWNIISRIDELVASALLPNGLLSQHVLAEIKSSKDDNFNAKINSEKIIQVQEIIFPYLQQQKNIDDDLVKKLFEIK